MFLINYLRQFKNSNSDVIRLLLYRFKILQVHCECINSANEMWQLLENKRSLYLETNRSLQNAS